MVFPAWIERERSPRERARLKLKHVLSLAGMHKFGSTSMHALARGIGCDHSSIFNALARGSFSEVMATKIESFFNDPALTAAWLQAPLSNERTTAK